MSSLGSTPNMRLMLTSEHGKISTSPRFAKLSQCTNSSQTSFKPRTRGIAIHLLLSTALTSTSLASQRVELFIPAETGTLRVLSRTTSVPDLQSLSAILVMTVGLRSCEIAAPRCGWQCSSECILRLRPVHQAHGIPLRLQVALGGKSLRSSSRATDPSSLPIRHLPPRQSRKISLYRTTSCHSVSVGKACTLRLTSVAECQKLSYPFQGESRYL